MGEAFKSVAAPLWCCKTCPKLTSVGSTRIYQRGQSLSRSRSSTLGAPPMPPTPQRTTIYHRGLGFAHRSPRWYLVRPPPESQEICIIPRWYLIVLIDTFSDILQIQRWYLKEMCTIRHNIFRFLHASICFHRWYLDLFDFACFYLFVLAGDLSSWIPQLWWTCVNIRMQIRLRYHRGCCTNKLTNDSNIE